MKISKGMYIRTEDGYISKCIDIDSDNFAFFDKPVYKNFSDTFDSCYLNNIDIKKASFNLIDLIEVGDYVNGYLVIGKPYKFYDTQFISLDTSESWNWGKEEMPIKYIETIITKEQFNSMKYVVERDKQMNDETINFLNNIDFDNNAEVYEKLSSLFEENQELKKQLKELERHSTNAINKQIARGINLINQQKEFIEYLENEIMEIRAKWGNALSNISQLDVAMTVRAYEEVLLKYKEIIGGDNK